MRIFILISSLLFSLCFFAQSHDTYLVKEGDSLDAIAKIYRVSPKDIKSTNPAISKNGFKKGMTLLIPNVKAGHYNTKKPVRFGIHIVKDKETMFAIAQTYNISQDDLRRYNIELKNNRLITGMDLTIPIFQEKKSDVVAVKKSGVVPYVVKPKEGKWRIAQNLGITVKELEKLNPNLQDPLKEGTEIWVPADKASTMIVNDSQKDGLVNYQIEKGEGFMSLTRKFNLSEDELKKLNPELKNGIKLEMQIGIPRQNFINYLTSEGETLAKDSNNYLAQNSKPANVKYMSFVLPFKVSSLEGVSEMKNKLQKDKLVGITADFYSGALIALDSLAKMGFSINVNTYDTQGSVSGVDALSKSEYLKRSQVVIGPFVASEFNRLAEIFSGTQTALIAPMTNKNIDLKPNVFQSVPTTETQQNKMIAFVNKKYPDANIILLTDGKTKDQNDKLKTSFYNAIEVENINEIPKSLNTSRPNIVFVSSDDVVFISDVIRILYSSAGLNKKEPTHNVIMATLDRGDAYDHSSISTTQLSALKFTFPSVNRYAGEMNSFIKRYYKEYKISPSRYAFRGFDLTMDAVLRTSLSGDLLKDTPSLGETSYQENKFAYSKAFSKGGGYQNEGVFIVRYNDLQVEEIY